MHMRSSIYTHYEMTLPGDRVIAPWHTLHLHQPCCHDPVDDTCTYSFRMPRKSDSCRVMPGVPDEMKMNQVHMNDRGGAIIIRYYITQYINILLLLWRILLLIRWHKGIIKHILHTAY